MIHFGSLPATLEKIELDGRTIELEFEKNIRIDVYGIKVGGSEKVADRIKYKFNIPIYFMPLFEDDHRVETKLHCISILNEKTISFEDKPGFKKDGSSKIEIIGERPILEDDRELIEAISRHINDIKFNHQL